MAVELDITELDLDLGSRHKGLGGRGENFPAILGVEAISVDEYEALFENRPGRSRSNITRIRASHHAIARLVAAGLKHVEIAEICHVSNSSIAQLLKDPLFAELVEDYQQLATETAFDFRSEIEVLAHRGLGAISDILEKHEEGEEELSPVFLKSLTTELLDRAGHSPIRRSISMNQHNHDVALVDKNDLHEIKQEAREKRQDIFQKVHSQKLDQGKQQLSLPQGSKETVPTD